MANADIPPVKQRIHSIDILRGLIMLIMVLDHSRDFLHFSGPQFNPTNMATTTVVLFFTRWITHFCAPVFVFLSGVSAYLSGIKRTKGGLSAFLIKRGTWLIFIEVVVMTFAISLNPMYNAILLDILWAIGSSMIILGLLVRAPLRVIAVIGALIFFGHDILDLIQLPTMGTGGVLIKIFFTAFGTVLPINSTHIILDLYAIIPWTGVMLLGYVFGSLYRPGFDRQKRKRTLFYSGVAAIALFIVLRFINVYGDPAPWAVQRNGVHTLLSFLNTSKYPPSLLFLCMTLGPALIVLSLAEQVQNKLTRIFIVYGNVPFFYYVLHLYLLRVINIILFFAAGFSTGQIKNPASPFLFTPATFGFPLWVVYLVWIFVMIAMYLPCRWYSQYKRTHHQWWLSYL